MTNSRARSIVGLLVAALAGGGVAGLTPHAAAVSVDVTCEGTETATYEPGLRQTAQPVSYAVNGVLSACSSSDPSIIAGTYGEQSSATLSCATFFAEASGTRVFRWSDGRSSTFAFDRAIKDAGGQSTVTLTGTIVKGEFVGSAVIEQVAFLTPRTTDCLISPGLAQLGPAKVALTISKE
ncbi:hypothetical protein [Nocardia altamirensis]|uniref:hypothetical protein n=1 Tax=Nocardia altamirensis TaxID=472158 RepID=UPI0008403949|nr:hypothetical protein [Nocardia altamirensis]